MWQTFLFSAVLGATSLVLMGWHVKAWREADHGGLTERDYEFHRRRCRRRMQSSGMLGIIGLLILGHLWVRENAWLALYWSGVLGLLVWTVLLAAADLAASRIHYAPEMASQKTEHLLLQREIEKFRRQSQAPPSSAPPKDSA